MLILGVLWNPSDFIETPRREGYYSGMCQETRLKVKSGLQVNFAVTHLFHRHSVTRLSSLLNLLTNYPVESPARLETSEGRNGVPSIQIHEPKCRGTGSCEVSF